MAFPGEDISAHFADKRMSSVSLGATPIRVLAMLDDTFLSGKVKPVVTLARYASQDRRLVQPLQISMLTFSRSSAAPEFVTAFRQEGLSIDVVRERRRFDLGVFSQLREIIDKRQPHVIWTHSAKSHFLVRIAGLARGRSWVAFHHGYTATSLTWRLYEQLDRWSLHGADRVMTACNAFAVDLNERLGIRKAALSVHRSPIVARSQAKETSEATYLRHRLHLPADARVVLSVGRLSKEKGHADLIQAMSQVKRTCGFPVVLLMLGDGPESARLENLCAQLDLSDSVRFMGYQPHVNAYYEAADVFVLPSYSEGSPNVLLEAMDADLPIVATAVGGVGEMISDRKNGLLVAAGDVAAIAGGVAALLNDTRLSRSLTVAARKSLDAYSPDRYFANAHHLFQEVLAHSPGLVSAAPPPP